MVPPGVSSETEVSALPWKHWKIQGYNLVGASDGSGEKNDGRSGAFAWVIAARKGTHLVLLNRGWGWEDMVSNYARGLIDSTRMELTGIAAGLTFAIQHYPRQPMT
jgi:ribonuclease HI